MSESRRSTSTSSTSTNLTPDSITERLVSDPVRVPDLVCLSGFLGRSTRESHIRLYLTPDLREYIDLSRESVVHSIQRHSDELSSTTCWVSADARVDWSIQIRRSGSQVETLRGETSASTFRSDRSRDTISVLDSSRRFESR